MPDPASSTLFDVFPILFAVVAAVILAVFVYAIVSAARSRKVLRDAGHDPATLSADLAVRAMQSDMMTPRKSIEERLAELDALEARGTISAAEHAAARMRIISGS